MSSSEFTFPIILTIIFQFLYEHVTVTKTEKVSVYQHVTVRYKNRKIIVKIIGKVNSEDDTFTAVGCSICYRFLRILLEFGNSRLDLLGLVWRLGNLFYFSFGIFSKRRERKKE